MKLCADIHVYVYRSAYLGLEEILQAAVSFPTKKQRADRGGIEYKNFYLFPWII